MKAARIKASYKKLTSNKIGMGEGVLIWEVDDEVMKLTSQYQ